MISALLLTLQNEYFLINRLVLLFIKNTFQKGKSIFLPLTHRKDVEVLTGILLRELETVQEIHL